MIDHEFAFCGNDNEGIKTALSGKLAHLNLYSSVRFTASRQVRKVHCDYKELDRVHFGK
jgi:hypothetical protein